MVKFRWSFNTNEATEWLNSMAKQGWALTGFFFGFYRFAECEPGEYIYQVDIAEKMFSVPESYRQFMGEMGVEIVCLWGPWVILRRKAEEGTFELYTDAESTYEHYRKIRNMFQAVSMIEGVGLFYGVTSAVMLKNAVGWVSALLAAVFLAVFLGQILRLNGILAELKNRREHGQGMASSVSGPRMHTVGIAICLICCAPFLYSFLHELGHCIAVWICGGTVTGFQPFGSDAHMTYKGVVGNLSLAFVDVAGMLLPLITAAAVLLLCRGSKKHSLLNISLVIMSGEFLLSIISWIVGPLCCLMDLANPGDDLVKFIDNTGFHPIAVSLCATLVFVSMVLLFAKRILGMFDNFSNSVGRKIIILVTSVVVIGQVFGLLFIFTRNNISAEGNFQYTAESSRDSILWEEFDIDISKAGEYIFYAKWEVDREGVIAAVVLKDEDEIYFDTTGATYLDVESFPFHLDSGSYNLSFYVLNCEEDWLEYSGLVGAEASAIEDFPWQPDGTSTVTGSYRLVYKR